MKKEIVVFIISVLILVFIISSCSNNSTPNLDLISVTVTYEDIAKENDFEKYHNVYSPETEIKLEKDNYYLIKVVCTINNKSSKKLLGLDFVSYSNKDVLYEAGAIDIEPMYTIDPNTIVSCEAYIYVDKSLNSEEKIKKALADINFNFVVWSYDDVPLDEYSTRIILQGNFEAEKVSQGTVLCVKAKN